MNNPATLSPMRIVLAAVQPSMARAWRAHCSDLPFAEVHEGSILDLNVDAVVSPANSFGFMDGGIDAVYLDHFGRQLQDRLREVIVEQHAGELLVGTAAILPTGASTIRHLIAAPTMRVPMILRDSVNPYLAARAVLLLLRDGTFTDGVPVSDRVRSVAFPGLGTGIGQISPNICAHQVRAAIDEVVLGKHAMPRSWAEASERHQLLYTDRLTRLQHRR
ncbi:MAG: macro domain-containing protein [Bacteroidota bacterium]